MLVDSEFDGEVDHAGQHVAAARHDEARLLVFFEHFFGRVQKVLGPFLERHAREEEHDLVVGLDDEAGLGELGLDRVEHDVDFVGRYCIVPDDVLFGVIGVGDNAVGRGERATLDFLDPWVFSIAPRAVVFDGVYVDDERLVRDFLGLDAASHGSG